ARPDAAVGRGERHAQAGRVQILARRARPGRGRDPGEDVELLRLSRQARPRGRLMRLFDLDGRIALVTGSTKGIGRGVAEVLCAQGAVVGVSSRSAQDCDAVARELSATYGEGR